MRTTRLCLLTGLLATICFAGCQKNVKDKLAPNPTGNSDVANKAPTPSGTCNPNAYVVQFESKTQSGTNWVWVWSVRNPNPGNGTNGTSQDLSHWGMQFGSCFNWASVVSAATSNDGIHWRAFTPSYEVDPSQDCVTTPVLKFDSGTSGSGKTYYRLILSHDYNVFSQFGYYKSGVRTGCCTFNFAGISCENPPN